MVSKKNIVARKFCGTLLRMTSPSKVFCCMEIEL